MAADQPLPFLYPQVWQDTYRIYYTPVWNAFFPTRILLRLPALLD